MTTLKVAVTTQGFEAVINSADYPEAIRDEWMEYGIRRWYQDHVNSVAKKLRDAGEEVDGAALFADRDKQAREGVTSRRGGGTGGRSALETAMIALARKAAKPGIAGYKGMTQAERDEAIWAYITGLSEAGQQTLAKVAEEKVARDAEDRAKQAMLAKLV